MWRWLKLGFIVVTLRLVILMSVVFFGYNIWRTFASDTSWLDLAFLIILLLCQLFLTTHGLVYFGNVIRSLRHEQRGESATENEREELLVLEDYPLIAIAVCAYKEPLEVVEDTLVCFRNLTYPNKLLLLLDDTRYDKGDPEEMLAYRSDIDRICRDVGINLFRREWHGAKAGMINDFLDFLCGRVRPDFEFTGFQGVSIDGIPKYLAIFDADMNPLSDFVEPIVDKMERDSNLAFVQTPQYYSNIFTNRVALGSAMQQAVFYEYICEGKSLKGFMPCCGTNVIFRVQALESVGGMDESSITEDFATSLKMHTLGWRSTYMNHVCAFGMGPQDLAGYFKQQFRWALGSVGLLQVVWKKFRENPRSLTLAGWTEYYASVSFYFFGWVWFFMWLAPVLHILFKFPSFNARIDVITALFFPYFIITLSIFIYSLSMRRYQAQGIILSFCMNALSFPIYMKASLLGVLGIKGSFGITPKDGATSVPLYKLWPQLTVVAVSVFAITWGALEVFYGNFDWKVYLTSAFWCLYNGGLVATILYLNRPTRKGRAQSPDTPVAVG